MEEYNEITSKDNGFKDKKIEEEKQAVEACIEQEIFNLKIEKIVGLDQEKRDFDVKFKEILLKYINNNSYKDKSNTGTIIGIWIFVYIKSLFIPNNFYN